MKAVAVQLDVGQAEIDVERVIDLAGGEVVLQEAERARLAAYLDEPGVIARLGHEIDGAAKREAAEAERVGALVDLDALGVEELERLEISEAVGVAVREAVEEDVDTAQVEVVAQARAADRDLALVGGAEARTDPHPRREVEDVLQIGGARFVDLPLIDEVHAARHPADLLARLALRLGTLGRHARALDDDGRQVRGGLRRRRLGRDRNGEAQRDDGQDRSLHACSPIAT